MLPRTQEGRHPVVILRVGDKIIHVPKYAKVLKGCKRSIGFGALPTAIHDTDLFNVQLSLKGRIPKGTLVTVAD